MASGSAPQAQKGFTYLAAMILVAVVGIGLAAAGETWSHARQREREKELVWIGSQFREAIGLYYQRTPGAMKRYPQSLDELLEDRRFLTRQRYLRRIYRDPVSGKADWGLVPAPGGGFMGVHSLSGARPLDAEAFEAPTYRDRAFVYEPPAATPPYVGASDAGSQWSRR